MLTAKTITNRYASFNFIRFVLMPNRFTSKDPRKGKKTNELNEDYERLKTIYTIAVHTVSHLPQVLDNFLTATVTVFSTRYLIYY